MPYITSSNVIIDTAQIVDGVVATDDIADGAITNAKVNASAAIADSKLAQITTAGKVSGAALTSLASIPAGAGVIPAANTAPATATSLIPLPDWAWHDIDTTAGISSNTAMRIGRYYIPAKIVVANISFLVTLKTTNGTAKIACWSEDGQTQHFSVTTGTVTGTGVVTTAVSSVTLNPGIYYIGSLSVGSADFSLPSFQAKTISAIDMGNTLYGGISSEPDRQGTITVTADTIPATIDPTAITYLANCQWVYRLDA